MGQEISAIKYFTRQLKTYQELTGQLKKEEERKHTARGEGDSEGEGSGGKGKHTRGGRNGESIDGGGGGGDGNIVFRGLMPGATMEEKLPVILGK